MHVDATSTTVDLMRHGEPEGGRRIRGSQDDPLSALGWRQMRAAVAGAAPWQRIISSPLLRCREFSHELAERLAIPLRIEPGLREVHFGLWEGLDSRQVMARWPDRLDEVWRDPLTYTPPEGESLVNFTARVSAVWDAILASYAGEHLLVIAHGGTIRIILCHILGLSVQHMWSIDVEYASLSRLRAWQRSQSSVDYSLISHAAPLIEASL